MPRASLEFQPTPSLRRATIAAISSRPFLSISTHALLAEGDLLLRAVIGLSVISTHALLAEGDVRAALRYKATGAISTHALLAEGDCGAYGCACQTKEFQPTPSLRRATSWAGHRRPCRRIISTHALLSEGDAIAANLDMFNQISTHALLAEGDVLRALHDDGGISISTHALLAEGDQPVRHLLERFALFQPTPSLRRATSRQCGTSGQCFSNFNPRPPCGGRPNAL